MDLSALRTAAESAQAPYLALKPCEYVEGMFECPSCNGDGSVDGATHNSDSMPIGLQVFGIGEDMTALEQYLAAITPATVLRLLAVVEAAKAYHAEGDGADEYTWKALGAALDAL